jgi:hypothetical protein
MKRHIHPAWLIIALMSAILIDGLLKQLLGLPLNQ